MPGRREVENRGAPQRHADHLWTACKNLGELWRNVDASRAALHLPDLPPGRPLVLLVEEDVDVEFLRSAFGFEIIAEEDQGSVLASTEDTDFSALQDKLEKFVVGERGGGSAAKLYELFDRESTEQRLQRVLSDGLLVRWPTISDDEQLVVDISVSCMGSTPLPAVPQQGENETDGHFEERLARHAKRCRDVLLAWDEVQRRREEHIEQSIRESGGTIASITQDPGVGAFHLRDSFTVRARISGVYFRDLAQNHPYVFQISEPEDVESPEGEESVGGEPPPELLPPLDDAPVVCVVDSGMEEGHRYLEPAIVADESRCFVPGLSPTDTADYVSPNGHGTRVAGAVLYPRVLPAPGTQTTLPCWLQNARVLDAGNKVPEDLMPALYMERVVEHFHSPERRMPARLFNHSVNSQAPGRHVHMSTWAAAIDKLSFHSDVLVIQSAGNIPPRVVANHLADGRRYPDYQLLPSSRIRNPGQSLAALTVGSVAHTWWQSGPRSSIAHEHQPSGFSPAGEGIWGSVKPDVVEYGGDYVVDPGPPLRTFPASPVAHEMVRATMHSPGATSKDDVGTSFAAPKVSHIAAMLQRELPAEPCLLYRALIANSARWPTWAEDIEHKCSVLRRIGYGIPDLARATMNSDYRVTLISSGQQQISSRVAHVYHVPIPEELRSPEHDYLVRIDVTLSYVAEPRRTRRRIKGYLATWLDWDVSKEGESVGSFINRIFRDGNQGETDGGDLFQWTLRDRVDHGLVQGMSRQSSTLQKDWCHVRSHQLPPDFCIAVVGHPGWNPSSEALAKYALAVSIEAVNEDLLVYQPIRVAIESQVRVDVRERIQVPVDSESE